MLVRSGCQGVLIGFESLNPANLRDMNEVPKWSMPTLAYHEGVPGHHWQLSRAQELKGVPQFRKIIPFTAYMEGWALYCEWLAKKSGWYDSDPFGVNQFGHPYQGAMYHGFARSAGFDYWHSLGYAFAGSIVWEIAGERTRPSRNDQVASGVGGTFLGEALFRMV